MDIQNFLEGLEFEAHEFFGAHLLELGKGATFRVYAPNASKVSLVGDFNDWQEYEMANDHGIFSATEVNAKEGDIYKYRIYDKEGNCVEHLDPYGFQMELRPKFGSIIVDRKYEWNDQKFLQERDKDFNSPLNIYEIHLGSWKMKDAEEIEDKWYTYEELSKMLPKYLVEQGYNAVELMPIAEHPADISWGYQNTGFFAPTSRYGTPKQLKMLIDSLHAKGIKVILDLVMVHFATDNYALANFDGTPLYEGIEDGKAVSEWGSYNFNYSKGEVRSFLQSNANYWLSEFHIDGLRIDAVSRLLYWHGNRDLGENEPGIIFLKYMNYRLQELHPSALLIAEDSTDYAKVTAKVAHGGLGFDYKWDMGWMNDSMEFFKKTPEQRREYINKISFSMMYFYNEKFMLPLSHDENVHSKATILTKMYGGDQYDKFAQARAFYMYMYTHPGKKLNFMGSELGQIREWSEEQQQDWILLEYPIHDAFNRYMKQLHKLYLEKKSLYKDDLNYRSFTWKVVDDSLGVVFAYTRQVEDEQLFVALNLGGEHHENYYFQFEQKHKFKEIINSDWEIYNGSKTVEDEIIECFPKLKEEYIKEMAKIEAQLVRLEKLKEIDTAREASLKQVQIGLTGKLKEQEDFVKKCQIINSGDKIDPNILYETSIAKEKIEDLKKRIREMDDEIADSQRCIYLLETEMKNKNDRIQTLKNEENTSYYSYILNLDMEKHSARIFEIVE